MLKLVAVYSVALAVVTCSPPKSCRAGEPRCDQTAILEIAAPDAAVISVDGCVVTHDCRVPVRRENREGLTTAIGTGLPGGQPVVSQVYLHNGWRTALTVLGSRHREAEAVPQIGHATAIESVSIDGHGRFGLTTSWDGTAALWDLLTGERIRTFAGHTAAVGAGAIALGGRRVLTGSDDGTAITWNGSTGEAVSTVAGGGATFESVALSSDGGAGSRERPVERS